MATRFFEITKRIHNNLYGTPGDGGPLGSAEHADYEATLRRNTADVLALCDRKTSSFCTTPNLRG